MQKTHFYETEQESEPDLALLLEWSDLGFKAVTVNLWRALMDKADSM